MYLNKSAIRSAVLFLAQSRLKRYRETSTDQIEAYCPFPHNRPKTRRSFYISMSTGLWLCHSCGRRGNLPRLYMLMGMEIDSELEALLKQASAEDIIPIKYRQKRGQDILPMEAAIIFSGRGPASLLQAGFTKKTLQDHLIGIDPRASRFTVPIWSKDGKLRAISGRALEEGQEPRYLVYGRDDLDHVVDPTSLRSYEPRPKQYLWREEKLRDRSDLFIAEGFKATMWLAQMGLNSAGLMSTGITSEQVATVDYFSPTMIYLVLDNDSAGIVGTERVARRLGGIAPIRVFSYPQIGTGESPDDLDQGQIESGIAMATNLIEWRSQKDVWKTIQAENPHGEDVPIS